MGKFVKTDTPSVVWVMGINDKKYPITDENGNPSKEYKLWTAMLQRCYSTSKQYASYAKVTVDERFHKFSDFYEWCHNQIGWKEVTTTHDWGMDKDILQRGVEEKVYSPDICVFVPAEVNSYFTTRKAKRGDLPLGVCYHKPHNKYVAQIGNGSGRPITLGAYKTVEEAFDVYKEAKRLRGIELANTWRCIIDDRVIAVLEDYIVTVDM